MLRRLITTVIFVILCVINSYAQKKYALLVGISNYYALNKANEWNNIHGTNDVSLITPTLKKQGFNVSVITDTKATHANILKQLKQLTNKASKGAIVYLHFSCHGQPFEDENGDEDDGWDESLVPIDAPIAYKKAHTRVKTTLRMMYLQNTLMLCVSNLEVKGNSMSSLMLAMLEKLHAILMMRRSHEAQRVAFLQAARYIALRAVIGRILWYL